MNIKVNGYLWYNESGTNVKSKTFSVQKKKKEKVIRVSKMKEKRKNK